MTRISRLLVLFTALAVPATAQVAGDPDAEGCKDSKLLTRMPGCTLASCQNEEFEAAELQIKAVDADSGLAPKQSVERALEKLEYYCPTKYSLLQLIRNAESALKQAGFTIVFSGKSEAGNDWPAVTARKGPQWVNVEAFDIGGDRGYRQTAALEQAMRQDMAADATAMAAQIDRSGSVAVYGINFETAKAVIQPGSEPVLEEVAKLLQERTEWRVEVQGHTDNVGQKAANVTLSQQRGRAVVAWLTKNGIAASRLVPQGYGDAMPVADNSTEEGRSKNRRVELKKINEE